MDTNASMPRSSITHPVFVVRISFRTVCNSQRRNGGKEIRKVRRSLAAARG